MEPVSRATADVYVDGKKEGGGKEAGSTMCRRARRDCNIYAHLFLRQVSGRTEHCRHRSQYAYH